MLPGDLVVLTYKMDGLPWRVALYNNGPHTPPHFRRGWINPGEILLVVDRVTFHGFGGAHEWLEVAGTASRGWARAGVFEVCSEQ